MAQQHNIRDIPSNQNSTREDNEKAQLFRTEIKDTKKQEISKVKYQKGWQLKASKMHTSMSSWLDTDLYEQLSMIYHN
jgi:hypothetical protein